MDSDQGYRPPKGISIGFWAGYIMRQPKLRDAFVDLEPEIIAAWEATKAEESEFVRQAGISEVFEMDRSQLQAELRRWLKEIEYWQAALAKAEEPIQRDFAQRRIAHARERVTWMAQLLALRTRNAQTEINALRQKLRVA